MAYVEMKFLSKVAMNFLLMAWLLPAPSFGNAAHPAMTDQFVKSTRAGYIKRRSHDLTLEQVKIGSALEFSQLDEGIRRETIDLIKQAKGNLIFDVDYGSSPLSYAAGFARISLTNFTVRPWYSSMSQHDQREKHCEPSAFESFNWTEWDATRSSGFLIAVNENLNLQLRALPGLLSMQESGYRIACHQASNRRAVSCRRSYH